jgi:hypothetical protein
MGLRGLGSKRTRSPAHALELEVAVDTVRARVAIDPACQVLDEENDYTSELPWRTPSPAASNAKLREGWKDWNSAESVPFLDFLDSNHDITDKKIRSDFVGKDNEASTVEQEPTGSQFVDVKDEESEEGFMFPGPADPSTEPDGWQKRDARTASDLQSADRVPVGVDRDSRDFVKLSVGRRERGSGGRMGRSTKVRNLLATAQRARATRLAQSMARPPDAPAPEEQSQDESETGRSANDETDSQVTELSTLSKRGIIVRDLPQKARQEDVYAALSGYGELERVVVNHAGSFAHVLFRSEDACKAALLSKHGKRAVDAVRSGGGDKDGRVGRSERERARGKEREGAAGHGNERRRCVVCVFMCVCVLVYVGVHACVRAQTRARVYAHAPGAAPMKTLTLRALQSRSWTMTLIWCAAPIAWALSPSGACTTPGSLPFPSLGVPTRRGTGSLDLALLARSTTIPLARACGGRSTGCRMTTWRATSQKDGARSYR